VDILVADGGVPKNGVMTAGHCFNLDSPPELTKYSINTTSGDAPATGNFYVFDERGDYGVLELGNGYRGRTTMDDLLHVAEAVQEPVVGAVACKDGATTILTCGEIQQVNVSTLTEHGPDASLILLTGMTRASYCAEDGDSGAPVYFEIDHGRSDYAVAAIGLHSTSVLYPDAQDNNVCGEKVNEPNESYFTPVSGIDTEGKFAVRVDSE
jgi:hypothetical protein